MGQLAQIPSRRLVQLGKHLTTQGSRNDLRHGETIRAYLEDLARLHTPVLFRLVPGGDSTFETTLERVAKDTFVTTTTPPLEPKQAVHLSFQLDSRWFEAHCVALSPGVFSLPSSISLGEKRQYPRVVLGREDQIEAFLLERVDDTIVSGRYLQGKLIDLSVHGCKVALSEVGAITGPTTPIRRGDSFASVVIDGLPHTPAIQCAGLVAHVDRTGPVASAGIMLTGLRVEDERALERILARRLPATFGQAFPAKKRKTDIADQSGTPTLTKVTPKAPEVVAWAPEKAPEPEVTVGPSPESAVARLRKAGRKILLISAHPAAQTLAEGLRLDGFKNVHEAKSSPEAQALAKRMNFDLVILDVKVGGHWGQDVLGFLRKQKLLEDTPVILLVEQRNETAKNIALELGVVGFYARGSGDGELRTRVHRFLIDGE